MSKCIYDLSEDCNNTDCLDCVLDKIRAEIERTYETDIGFLIHDKTKRTILNIIDKYRQE